MNHQIQAVPQSARIHCLRLAEKEMAWVRVSAHPPMVPSMGMRLGMGVEMGVVGPMGQDLPPFLGYEARALDMPEC